MKSRHRSREISLQILYQCDLTSAVPSTPEELISRLQYHYEHFNVPDSLREFIGQLVAGTLREMPAIDLLLEEHATHWKVSRMSSIDRCLLRLAVYEMIFLKETPPSVIIDEAIELAKQFGTSETPSFINGILDSIKAKSLA